MNDPTLVVPPVRIAWSDVQAELQTRWPELMWVLTSRDDGVHGFCDGVIVASFMGWTHKPTTTLSVSVHLPTPDGKAFHLLVAIARMLWKRGKP